jgi:hypothetical protein
VEECISPVASEAASTNRAAVLGARVLACAETRGLPTLVYVDFVQVGDTVAVVEAINGPGPVADRLAALRATLTPWQIGDLAPVVGEVPADAPRVEVNLAEASAAQAEALVENYRGREQGARAALDRTFPAIPVPAVARIGRPRPLEQGLDWFVEQVRLHNDEIRVARAAARRGLMVARRAGAERLVHPAATARLKF